jgi:hypothetical protein
LLTDAVSRTGNTVPGTPQPPPLNPSVAVGPTEQHVCITTRITGEIRRFPAENSVAEASKYGVCGTDVLGETSLAALHV